MKTLDEELNNTYIKEAAQKFIKSEEPEEMFLLIAQILCRIKDDGTAPTPMMNSTDIVWGVPPDVELEDVFPEEDGPAIIISLALSIFSAISSAILEIHFS